MVILNSKVKRRQNGNSEVRQVVDKLFSEHFERFLYENPQVARTVVEKGIMAARARVAAKKRVKLHVVNQR